MVYQKLTITICSWSSAQPSVSIRGWNICNIIKQNVKTVLVTLLGHHTEPFLLRCQLLLASDNTATSLAVAAWITTVIIDYGSSSVTVQPLNQLLCLDDRNSKLLTVKKKCIKQVWSISSYNTKWWHKRLERMPHTKSRFNQKCGQLATHCHKRPPKPPVLQPSKFQRNWAMHG